MKFMENMINFIENPSRRRVVLMLTDSEIDDFKRKGYAGKLDSETAIVSSQIDMMENFEKYPVALRNIYQAKLNKPGLVLVQSPYDENVYQPIDQAENKFALEKFMYFSLLCNYLGAKKFNAQQGENENNSSNLDVIIYANGAAAGGETKNKYSFDSEIKKQLNLNDNFTGGEPNMVAAEELLRNTGLFTDVTMRSLVEARKNTMNSFLSRKLTLVLNSDIRRAFDSLNKIKTIAGASLDISAQAASQKSIEYFLEITIEF